MSSDEIEDVLSSIRRLVSEDLRRTPRPGEGRVSLVSEDPGRLILTPALRVVDDAGRTVPPVMVPPAAPPPEDAASELAAPVEAVAGDAETAKATDGPAPQDDDPAEAQGPDPVVEPEAAAPAVAEGWPQDATAGETDPGEGDPGEAGTWDADPAAAAEAEAAAVEDVSGRAGDATEGSTAPLDGAWTDAGAAPPEAAEDPAPQPEGAPDRVWPEAAGDDPDDWPAHDPEPLPEPQRPQPAAAEAAGRITAALDRGAGAGAALEWESETGDAPVTRLSWIEVTETAEEAEPPPRFVHRAAGAAPVMPAAAAAPDRRSADGDPALIAADEVLDEAILREIVRTVLREELQGNLGERITRNIRKLVRAEVHRALTLRETE